jgi:hypothetical protein
MKQQMQLGGLAFVLCMTLSALPIMAHADEVPVITGEQWVSSSEEVKKVFLIGAANFAKVEVAHQGSNPLSDNQSLVPRFQKGLKGQTLDTVREGLNKWYASHPERLQQPVIDTIWFEMVIPGLQQNK